MQYSREIGAARGIPTDLFLIRTGAIVIIVAEYVYALAFNVLPDAPRLAFAGGIFVLHTVMAFIAYTNRQSITNNLILLSMVITCVCWGLSYALEYVTK